MKTSSLLAGLVAVLVGVSLPAQESTQPKGAGLLERFRQLDRDGDGKLTREEGRALANFDEMDTDKDGFLTPQEIGTFYKPKGSSPFPPKALGREAIANDKTPPFPSPDGFKPDDVPVGDPGVSYQDPEFLPGGQCMTFVDRQRRVWVAELDPATGLTRSKTGQDILVGENWAPFQHSQNGPEWCLDKQGPAVAYTVLDDKGVAQLAMAQLGEKGAKPLRILTHGPQRSFSPFGTMWADDASTWLAFAHGGRGYADYFVRLLDTANPEKTFDLPYYWVGSSAPRWLHGTTRIVYPYLVKFGQVEIAVFDIATGKVTVLTDDGGSKDEVWGFFAPEYEGEVLYAAQVDNKEVRIYRDLKDRGSLLTKIASLHLPEKCPHPFMRSMEPLVDLRGAGGVSYFTVLAAPTPKTYARTDTSIWLLGLGKDPQQRIVRRVDDGAVTGVKRYRHEPETCSGPGEVFVYYSVETEEPGKGKTYGLRRCRTGIMQTNTPTSKSSRESRSVGRERELGLGEAVPEEPNQPLRRYLYLNMKDSSICPPIGMGSGDPQGGIVVLDMDHGMKFVKRIGSDLMMNGPCRVSSGPGARWMHGSAVTDRLYYGYSEPGAKYLRGVNAATPAPPNANAIIGCMDLRTDRVLWEQPTCNACCFAVFPDGKRLLAVPDMSQVRHRKLTVLDAMTGRTLATIDTGCVFHGVAVGAPGRFLFPSVGIGPLLVFDTDTGQAIPLADAYPTLRELDWGSVPELYRRFEALHVVRAYQANGAGDLLWSQLRNGPGGKPRDPNTADGGLILLDLKNRRAAVAPIEPALLNNAVEPGRSKKHHFAPREDDSIYWHGHGYCAAISPDERWFYHGNFEGDFRVIVWDNSFWPPRPVGIMGEGLSSEPQVDPVSGEKIGCHNKSGAWVSADGRIVFTSDSWYFDARTWKPLGLLRNEHGQIIRCSKMNEVQFRGKDCVYFGQRWGFGRYREPAKIFPPSTDKTPPTAARTLTASISTPEARWSGGDVVVSVELNWRPATDNDGVQRYAVYRDGELIGNGLGKNPGDPVLREADAAVFRAQVGEVKENSFTARFLKPGQRYRFAVEPIDFAQNRGPRVALDVAVPSVDAQTEDALIRRWAERILARAKETHAKECAVALTGWLDIKHRSRSWASALRFEIAEISNKKKP